MRVEEYLKSPQAQEDRERYWRMFGRQENLEGETDEDGDEMEEHY